MITITEQAKHKIKTLFSEDGGNNRYVRVSVKGGGCSGLMYDLSFDSQVLEGDTIVEDNEVNILINKKSVLYLAGMTLDFSDGLNGKGFQFVNPNATRTCGCGESFAV